MIDKLLVDFFIQAIIDNRTVILVTLLVFAKELLEFWLGRTDKVKAGSTLELLILAVKKIKDVFKN
jgi:hypothetical protein